MNDVNKYVKLTRVVAMFLDETNKTFADKDKFWNIALRGYTKIGFAIAFRPKTVRLPINANLTVTLPPDYISWSKIGVMNSNNEISALKVNRALTTLADNNPNRLDYLTPDVGFTQMNNLVASPYFANYYYNGYYTPFFGLGNGLVQYSEITVDEANGVIVLGKNYPFADIMIEYLSSSKKDNDYIVETCCQEALIAFMKWKAGMGTRADFYSEMTEARRSLKPIQLQILNDALRDGNSFKVKA